MAAKNESKIAGGEENTWQEMLKKCSRRSSEPERHIVILGSNHDGKYALFNKIEMNVQSEEQQSSIFESAISFSDFDVMELKPINKERIDISGKVNTWVFGAPGHDELLKLCIQAKNMENMVLVLCFDLKKPHSSIQLLEKWMVVVQKLAVEETCKLEVGQQDALKARVRKLCEMVLTQSKDNDDSDANNVAAECLDKSILTTNLGFPVVVVGTDSGQQKLSDEHFSFLQYSLRKFCLKYGAGLVFTSTSRDINCGALQQYILRLLYPQLLKSPLPKTEWMKPEAIFIPGGWDSHDYINQLRSEKLDFDSPFSTIIPAPKKVEEAKGRVKLAQDNQEFLAQLKKIQGKVSKSSRGRTRRTETSAALLRRTRTAAQNGQSEEGAENVKSEHLAQFFRELIRRPRGRTARDQTSKEQSRRPRGRTKRDQTARGKTRSKAIKKETTST